MNAIEIKNLTKRYGGRAVVEDLSFSVKQGEFISLLGVNGAGKTTTLKMLSCLTAPSEGDALIMGHSIANESTEVKKIIAVSPQETAVAPNLTVRENLEFMARIYGKKKAQAVKCANSMIESFMLGEFEKSKTSTLSGGCQRRLSIALALICEPQVLFLDEPTLGLDIIARRELWQHIGQLKGKITIILTTHYLEEAEALSDRIAVMANGRLRALGTVRELCEITKKSRFEDAFVGLCAEVTNTEKAD